MTPARSFRKRFPGSAVWPGKHWEHPLFLKETNQEVPTHTQLDERFDLLTFEECGVICGGKGKRQIQIWHQQGIFAAVLYFGKSPRVRRVDLAAWIAAGGTSPSRGRLVTGLPCLWS
jgi:hypothetical protein